MTGPAHWENEKPSMTAYKGPKHCMAPASVGRDRQRGLAIGVTPRW